MTGPLYEEKRHREDSHVETEAQARKLEEPPGGRKGKENSPREPPGEAHSPVDSMIWGFCPPEL